MRTVQRRIVAAHIVSADGKVLFGRKRPGAVYEDCWHIPGGGVDEGENDDQAVKREVTEETGITEGRVILIDNKGTGESEKTLEGGERVLVKMQFNIYKIEIDRPAAEIQVVESDDLVGFQWFGLDEFENIKLTPPEYVLLERIGSEWLRYDGVGEK